MSKMIFFGDRAKWRFPISFEIRVKEEDALKKIVEVFAERFGPDDMPNQTSNPGEQNGVWTYYRPGLELKFVFYFLHERDAVEAKFMIG